MLNLMVKNLSYAKIDVWTLEIILDLCLLLHIFLKPIKLIQRNKHLCTYRNNLKTNMPLTLTITNSICEQNFYTSALISFRLCTKCTDFLLKRLRHFMAIPIHIPLSATKYNIYTFNFTLSIPTVPLMHIHISLTDICISFFHFQHYFTSDNRSGQANFLMPNQ